jgi:hypothetical protein
MKYIRQFCSKLLNLTAIRIAGGLLFMSVTFLFGAVITRCSFELIPPHVTLCQLANNPSYYQYSLVVLEADGRGLSEAILVEDGSCPGSDLDAWAMVMPVDSYEPSEDVKAFFAGSKTEYYHARVLVTGRFNSDATRGCYGPKAAIKATDIRLKSDITTEPRPARYVESK